MAREMTAAEIAYFDQGMASAGDDYETLLELMRRSSAKQGRTRALCDVGAYVMHQYGPAGAVALLLAAISRDSEDGGEGKS